jgi:uncharacterized Zn finger protein
MNDLKFNFDESQTALYLFLLQTGGVKLTQLEDEDKKEQLKECYRQVKNGNISKRELNSTIDYWADPENPEVIIQKVSKINKKLKDLLGESLAMNYQIVNEKGIYKIKLPMNKVEIVRR